MKIGILITGRLKSTRLPLKLLLPLKGKKVIDHVIERAKQVNYMDQIILCTSYHPQDYPLIEAALKQNIYYFTGHPDDVLRRLFDAATFFQLDYILSITADNPLFSIEYANVIANDARLYQPDYMYIEGLPIGIGLYGISYDALKTVIKIKNHIDTEIWGHWFNQPDYFHVRTIQGRKGDYRNTRLTLDTYEDYLFLQRITAQMPREELYNYQSLLKVIDQIPHGEIHNNNIIQKQLPSDIKNEINLLYKKMVKDKKVNKNESV